MILRLPRATRTDTLFPSTTLFLALTAAIDGARNAAGDAADGTQQGAADVAAKAGAPEAADDGAADAGKLRMAVGGRAGDGLQIGRSEEHTSELQSLMRISYAVFCLKQKTTRLHQQPTNTCQA